MNHGHGNVLSVLLLMMLKIMLNAYLHANKANFPIYMTQIVHKKVWLTIEKHRRAPSN